MHQNSDARLELLTSKGGSFAACFFSRSLKRLRLMSALKTVGHAKSEQKTEGPAQRKDLWRNALAGVSGGFVSTMAMHPLDVVNTRLQVLAPGALGVYQKAAWLVRMMTHELSSCRCRTGGCRSFRSTDRHCTDSEALPLMRAYHSSTLVKLSSEFPARMAV